MGSYVPNTGKEQQEMLRVCGFQSMDELYGDIPDDLKRKEPLDIPEGKPEADVVRGMERMARKNHVYATVLRGAGAYRHYIPAIVGEVTGKE